MKNLFFDVETTGKALMKDGPGHPGQPRIVQIAAVLAEGDEEIASFAAIVKPTSFFIPPESTAIHGISQEAALANGVFLDSVLILFSDLASIAEGFVAHNIAFDYLVVLSEYSRNGRCDPFGDKPRYCTMKAATPICKLPGPYGFKWPKLSEAYQFAFNEPLQNAHDALADIRATKRVFEWLTRARGCEAAAINGTIPAREIGRGQDGLLRDSLGNPAGFARIA